MVLFLNQLINGLGTGAIYALIALGSQWYTAL